MADNIELNEGSGGATIRTDDDGSFQWQYVKLAWGADNTQTIVTATAGLPVAPETGSSWAVTQSGTWNINNVSGTISLPTGASTSTLQTNLVSTDNSTTSPLGIDAVYTGTGEDCSGYAAVAINIKADVDSAADGMSFQFSSDNSNWDDANEFTYTASEGSRRFQFPATAQYFRMVFTNGGTEQASFRLQTILHRKNILTSIHRLGDDISPDRSATLVKSIVAAQAAGSGDFMPVQATASGNFKVSIEETNGVLFEVVQDTAADLNMTEASAVAIKNAVEIMDDWDESNRAKVLDQVHIAIDQLSATASWAASTDAAGIAQESDHVPTHGVTNSLSIDKTGTSVPEASYGKTLGATVDGSVLGGDSTATFYVRHANYTNVNAVFIRIGTDASNYMEFAVDPSELSTTLWSQIVVPLHEGTQTGTGLDLANIDYVAFGVTMTANGNTISDVFFNAIELHSVGATELTVTSDVTSSNVRVSKMGAVANQNVATGAGAVTTGVQRTTLASDDPAVVSLGIMDDWDESDRAKVNLIAGQAGIAGGTGADGATVPRVTLATDVGLPTGSNAIGKVDVTSVVPGVAATNLGKARASALGATDTGVMPLAVRNDDLADLAGADGDYTPLQADSNGAVYVNQAAAENKSAFGVAVGGAPGTDDMIAAVPGKKILVTAMALTASSATTNNVFVDNADHDLWHNTGNPFPMSIDADGDTSPGIVLNYNPAGWFKTDTVNEAVTLNTSAAQDIAWSISWIETD